MRESNFRTEFLKRVKDLRPNEIFVEFADPHRINGIPDVIIFYRDKHVRLETKKSSDASKRKHQNYYIDLFNSFGVYSAFLSPENEEEVFNAIRRYFKI